MSKKIKDIVKEFLEKRPETRDCNYTLYAWYMHLYVEEYRQLSLLEYLQCMTEGKYPKIETVTRCSRQLQEKHPELRGKEWKERQRQVKPVQESLGYNTK